MCKLDKPGNVIPTVIIDNKRTRITKWHFKNHWDNTGWHRHQYDYIVTPLFDGKLEINIGSGENTNALMQNGIPYSQEVGAEHDVINGNVFECAFIEIEFLE